MVRPVSSSNSSSWAHGLPLKFDDCHGNDGSADYNTAPQIPAVTESDQLLLLELPLFKLRSPRLDLLSEAVNFNDLLLLSVRIRRTRLSGIGSTAVAGSSADDEQEDVSAFLHRSAASWARSPLADRLQLLATWTLYGQREGVADLKFRQKIDNPCAQTTSRDDLSVRSPGVQLISGQQLASEDCPYVSQAGCVVIGLELEATPGSD